MTQRRSHEDEIDRVLVFYRQLIYLASCDASRSVLASKRCERTNLPLATVLCSAIMIEMNNLPKDKPRKLKYIWRDVERRARRYGLSPRVPASYPLVEFDLANRVALVACDEGWCAE